MLYRELENTGMYRHTIIASNYQLRTYRGQKQTNESRDSSNNMLSCDTICYIIVMCFILLLLCRSRDGTTKKSKKRILVKNRLLLLRVNGLANLQKICLMTPVSLHNNYYCI